MRASRPPRIYYSHVALVSSIREPSSFFFSRRGEWDALMEDNYVWVIVTFKRLMTNFETVMDSYL